MKVPKHLRSSKLLACATILSWYVQSRGVCFFCGAVSLSGYLMGRSETYHLQRAKQEVLRPFKSNSQHTFQAFPGVFFWAFSSCSHADCQADMTSESAVGACLQAVQSYRRSKFLGEIKVFLSRASERRVLLIVGVCYIHLQTSSYLLIFTSSHLHIFTSSLSCPLALLPSCPLALLPSCILISLLF